MTNKLEEAVSILKREFIGLDGIIDEIKNLITPWYLTPEVIKRPVIISLWGMTGTGKSSVVKRLLELLDLTPRTLFLDCGAEENDGNRVNEKISTFLNIDRENESSADVVIDEKTIFVLDEFQYTRTINDSGEEVEKSNLRPFWNLMDSGKLNFVEYSWETNNLISFFEDFKEFSRGHEEIKLNNLLIEDPKEVKEVIDNLGFFYYDRGIPGLLEKCCKYSLESIDDPEKDNEEDPYRPLKVFNDYQIRVILKKLKKNKKSDILGELLELKTVGELVGWIDSVKNEFRSTSEVDCSKSLIFVIGNLDEAFRVGEEIDPDLDADIFYDETSAVSINDIKNSLKRRFRVEQIARFGNTIIKYPTLKKEHFKEIIKKEISKACEDFYKENKIKVIPSSDIYDLIYSEGVYPTQGVRPIFTTIGTIFTPIFSDILINYKSGEEVEVKIKDPEKGYRVSEKTILIGTQEKNIKLTLGALRDPGNRKKRYITSVHESGHAILLTYLTGELPLSITSVSSDRGGFCTTHNKDRNIEIMSKLDIENDVMISLGGYLAEKIIFGERPETILLGSENDLYNAWESIRNAAYCLGFFNPVVYSNYQVEYTQTGSPNGKNSKTIDTEIEKYLDNLTKLAETILRDNINLLKNTALVLGEKGSISGEEFLELIKKYHDKNTLGETRIKEAKELCSYDWYEKKLREV